MQSIFILIYLVEEISSVLSIREGKKREREKIINAALKSLTRFFHV